MTNEEKYMNAFMRAFDIDADTAMNLEFQAIPEWDSVGHMGLVAELEEALEIMLEPDDIVDLSSYAKGKELLAKYGITF